MQAKKEWQFEFVIHSDDMLEPVSESQCNELFGHILDWVEARGLALGGGFHLVAPKTGEVET